MVLVAPAQSGCVTEIFGVKSTPCPACSHPDTLRLDALDDEGVVLLDRARIGDDNLVRAFVRTGTALGLCSLSAPTLRDLADALRNAGGGA